MITPERKKEIVSKTVQGLREQGGYSLYSSMGGQICRYRGSAGKKCAVGVHIPDDLYSLEMEGEMVHNKIIAQALAVTGITKDGERDLLLKLQNIHDTRAYNFLQSPFGLEKDHLEDTVKLMEGL